LAFQYALSQTLQRERLPPARSLRMPKSSSGFVSPHTGQVFLPSRTNILSGLNFLSVLLSTISIKTPALHRIMLFFDSMLNTAE
jgi:hypothetical protein